MMKYLVGNQKNSLTREETISFCSQLVVNNPYCQVILCPSSLYFSDCKHSNFALGIQDVTVQTPITGRIGIHQVTDLDIEYVLVNHSDYKEIYRDTKEELGQTMRQILSRGLIPILCVGEKTKERSIDFVSSTAFEEIKSALDQLSTEMVEKVIIAYEPTWAISDGTYQSQMPSKEDVEYIVINLKAKIKELFGVNLKVLYGGSVHKNNIDDLNQIKTLDGYLVGAASTKIEHFQQLINKIR